MRYPSKIDSWLIILLAFPPVLIVIIALVLQRYVILLPALVPIVISGLLVFPCVYTLEDERLLIQCGLIRIKIPYSEITSVNPHKRTMYSSPALSLDRMEIAYGSRKIYISPVRKQEFADELKKRAKLD